MPNPFPGVNPYIEAAGLWPGFHNLMVGDCSRLLNRVLKPRGYAAFVEERIELVDLPSYELVRVAYVELRYLPDQQLVTSIELLSPSNKGRSRSGYLAKRRAVLATDVSLVEVDLLLGGRRPDVVGQMPPGEFCALVSRGDQRPRSQAYAWSIRQPLPAIAIPLRPGDPDVMLDLAAAYSLTYEDGPYDVATLYGQPLAGPLSPADLAWVAERIAPAGGTP